MQEWLRRRGEVSKKYMVKLCILRILLLFFFFFKKECLINISLFLFFLIQGNCCIQNVKEIKWVNYWLLYF